MSEQTRELDVLRRLVDERKRNEERLRTSVGRLHAIVQTQQEISALELDRDAVTTTLVQRAQRLAGADGAAVQWFQGHEAVMHQGSGLAAPHVGLRLDRSTSLAGAAALHGEALYSPDTQLDPRVDNEACARLGARSLICAPLYREGRVEGALSVMGRERDAFDELSIETTRMMADFVSTVIRNADELETRRELAERLRTQGQVVEHMQTALWVWKVDGETLRLDYANAASVAATGLQPADIVGRTIEEVLPGLGPAVKRSLLDVIASDEPLDFGEVEYGDERLQRGSFTVKAFPLSGGRLAVTFDNVTEARRVEVQLRQAQKMEAVGRLAGGIAHDFNNLLTAISGYSEFLIEGQTDERQRRYAEEIKRAATRAAALTGQLLAFSRRQVLQPRVLDLNAVVGDMDMMLRRLIGEDVELVTMLDPALANVLADPTQIEQVIVNLAVNAREAMPHGGSVTIETANLETDAGQFADLRLTDTGVGMSDEERRQLFDPFFTTKDGGTGLGLATVYGIVEQSGGTIEVESAPGLGSSFRILLPAAEAPAAEMQAPRNEAPARGSETVLLVEDEAVVRHLVAEILTANGYSVVQAADGPSALELLRRHTERVDLLLTDVVMPGMSGPEVANAVSAMRPGTRVLYISGYTDSAIGHHGVLEPGMAFLQKPFSTADLTGKVRAVLDEAAAPVD